MNTAFKYAYVGFATVFFALMWGLHMRANLVAPPAGDYFVDYETLLRPDEVDPPPTVWGIYLGDLKVGGCTIKITREENRDIMVRAKTTATKAVTAVLGFEEGLDIEFQASISPLRGVHMLWVNSEQADIRIRGKLVDGEMHIIGRIGNQKVKTSIPHNRNWILGGALSPMTVMPELNRNMIGASWTLRMLDPLSGGVRPMEVTATVVEIADIVLDEQPEPVFKLLFRTRRAVWYAWVRQNGELLVQGSPLPIILRREDLPADVMDILLRSRRVPQRGR